MFSVLCAQETVLGNCCSIYCFFGSLKGLLTLLNEEVKKVETAEKAGVDCIKTPAREEKIFAGVCRGNCASGCLLNIHVRDGKVVKTSMREMPNPEYLFV
jgi:anaerobic selenocysteine-containing dehydrogenase